MLNMFSMWANNASDLNHMAKECQSEALGKYQKTGVISATEIERIADLKKKVMLCEFAAGRVWR